VQKILAHFTSPAGFATCRELRPTVAFYSNPARLPTFDQLDFKPGEKRESAESMFLLEWSFVWRYYWAITITLLRYVRAQ